MDTTCPHCGKHLRPKAEWVGRTATCKSCNGRFVIPAPSSSNDDEIQFELVQPSENSNPLARPVESDENPFDFLTDVITEVPSDNRSSAAKPLRQKFRLTIILGVCFFALLAGVIAMRSMVSTADNKDEIAEDPESRSPSDKSRKVTKAKAGNTIERRNPNAGMVNPGLAAPVPEAVKNLLSKVNDVSPDDLSRYEKALETNTFFNWSLFLGVLRGSSNEVQQVKNLGSEKIAVSALIELLKDKQDSNDKTDHIVCVKALDALVELGPVSMEAAPLLERLKNHQSPAVKSTVSVALKEVSKAKAANGIEGQNLNAVNVTTELTNAPQAARLKAEQGKEVRHQAEAAANPLAQAASLPKEPRPARIVRNSRALPKSGPDEWLAALKMATGIDTAKVDVFLFLTDFNRLYDKTRFREDESANLISRMKIVPKTEIDIWNEALTKSVDGRLISYLSNDSAALVVIIQQDVLFKEQAFDHAMSQVLCQRLATIPKSAVEEVTGIGSQNSAMQGTDAALAIAKYDPLFVGNQFQPNVWGALKR